MRCAIRLALVPCVSICILAGGQAYADEAIVFVRAMLQYPDIVPMSSRVVNGVLPPRFDSSAGVQVQVCDSDDSVLASYQRWDPRLTYLEDEGTSQAPDGTQILFSAKVIDGMRKIRVMDTEDSMVLEEDLGPALVEGCQTGSIAQAVCATFDSDGDGCKDLEDDNPLVPETQPPILNVSIAPSRLWPPDHRLETIEATVGVTDNCDDSPQVVLHSITSSEPDDGTGDGDTVNDIQGADVGTLDLEFALRSERIGRGRGRIYTVAYTATDRAGNTTMTTAEVLVPRDASSMMLPSTEFIVAGITPPEATIP